MSSHYEPIPIESDDENEHVSETAPMSEDDARTDRTRSTDRSHYFQQGVDRPHFFQGGTTNSDEDPDEDPEEDNPASVDLRRPLNGHTTREREATPYPHQCTQSSSPTYFTDPYVQPHPGFQMWERTLRTLQRWKDGTQYTPIPSGDGGSSSTRQEFLLDTTPIVVDQVSRHEDRLDMMENIIMGIPGNDAFEGLEGRVNDAEENISYVNDEVQSMKARVEEMARRFQSMDCSINRMERQMGDCHTMTAMAQGTTQDNLREFFRRDGK